MKFIHFITTSLLLIGCSSEKHEAVPVGNKPEPEKIIEESNEVEFQLFSANYTANLPIGAFISEESNGSVSIKLEPEATVEMILVDPHRLEPPKVAGNLVKTYTEYNDWVSDARKYRFFGDDSDVKGFVYSGNSLTAVFNASGEDIGTTTMHYFVDIVETVARD